MKSLQQIGAQSYCFRHFKVLADYLAQTTKATATNIELCGIHQDFSKPETFDATLAQCKAAGVTIQSIGVQHVGKNPPVERHYFEFCQRAGVHHMSISFAPDAMWDGLRGAEKLAQDFDIKLGIHNHGGYDWLGNSVMLDYIFKHTSEHVGLCLDTAWAMDAGQDVLKMVERFGHRLYGLHVKDFVFDPAGQGHDVIVGKGNLNLPGLVEALRNVNFDGFAVVEYELDEESPAASVRQCLEAVRALVA